MLSVTSGPHDQLKGLNRMQKEDHYSKVYDRVNNAISEQRLSFVLQKSEPSFLQHTTDLPNASHCWVTHVWYCSTRQYLMPFEKLFRLQYIGQDIKSRH